MLRLVSRAATLLALILIALGAGSALANSTTTYQVLTFGDDSFYNWDNETTQCGGSGQPACKDRVDWPVNMIFYPNADVNKAKDAVGRTNHLASSMNFRGNDGAGWFWDSDEGEKHQWSGDSDSFHHIRIYAPPSTDYFYNTRWSRYVVATTHIDKDESSFSPKYGWSETAEEYFVGKLRDKGYHVVDDVTWMANNDSWPTTRQDGNDYYLNNGYASQVTLP